MKIPRRGLEQFVRQVANDCTASRPDRINRGNYYKSYAFYGADQPSNVALFNKTFAYLDDLESLLYSPISLQFGIRDLELPNMVTEAKGRAAASRLRQQFRASHTDTMISEAIYWSLVKGKSLIKQSWKRGGFAPDLVQPEALGVLHENHTRLDIDMEAFVHSTPITPYQFDRLISNNPERDKLRRQAKKFMSQQTGGMPGVDDASAKQVIVGGLYPFQPAGSNTPNNTRGVVDWLGGPTPTMSAKVMASFIWLDEVWIWDDDRDGWATFQIIGDDMLIWGKDFIANIMAWDTSTAMENPKLIDKHPFTEFCPNRVADYFWGRSEIANVALLQEAINARINGTNKILRLEEDPPKTFIGSTGINQVAMSRFNKPGGYWNDTNPNAKVASMAPQMPRDLWGSLHEFERMFDEMGGLPPIAKGRGDAGVRSAGHAETLVRMFSPRFKDRALLCERDVEGLAAISLDLASAHDGNRLVAWVDGAAAGAEAEPANPLIVPPAPGQVAVLFNYNDLDENVAVSVDSHSSSPAFQMEARALVFDLFKIGAAGPEDVIEHVDAPESETLLAGLKRRQIAQAEAVKEENAVKLAQARTR